MAEAVNLKVMLCMMLVALDDRFSGLICICPHGLYSRPGLHYTLQLT